MYILIYAPDRNGSMTRPARPHNIPGRTSVRTLVDRLVVLAALAMPCAAHAQANAQGNVPAWPAGTIKLVVPYPPGGSTDVIARLVQPCLQERLATTIIVENRAGASGSVGTVAVAKAPADGSSWLIVFDNHAANPFVLPDLPYDTEKDLDPVLFIGAAPFVVSTHVQKPFQSLGDARSGQLWLGRQRQRRPPRHGAAVEAGRHPARPRALSRQALSRNSATISKVSDVSVPIVSESAYRAL